MSAIAAIIAFVIQHNRLFAIAAGVLALLGALWWLYSAIYAAGQADTQKKWDASVRAAEAKAAADAALLQSALAEIDTGIQIDMEAVNATRTLYRDRIRTVAVDVYRDRDCNLPDGLWHDLNAVRAATNSPVAGESR